ncbi:MAG: NAD(+)/NADH kinase [Ilumatobacteraceae bacterium]
MSTLHSHADAHASGRDLAAHQSVDLAVHNVCIVAHHTRADVGSLAAKIAAWLGESGRHVWMPAADAAAHGMSAVGSDRSPRDADLVVVLGGDGTVLRAVSLIDGAPIPVLGVNVGTIGYLTETVPDDVMTALAAVCANDRSSVSIDERMMMSARVVHGNLAGTAWRALNEVVLEKQMSGHTVWIDVQISGELFEGYSADGIIIATPTGSTAYSLSARGPVVSPRHRALVVTPVSAHMNFDRSLVLDPSESLSMTVTGTRPVDVVVDGRKVATLEVGARVDFAPDSCTVRFVRFGAPRFHQVLRTKFGGHVD